MNLFQAMLRSGPMLELDGGPSLPLRKAPAGSEGRPVLFGIRPEHVVLGASEGTPAEIAVVEPTGSETFVVAKIGEREVVCLLRERPDVRPGQEVRISVTAEAAHFFDPATGLRLPL